MLRVLQGSAGQKIRGHGYLLVYMKTAKKSNPQQFFSPKSRKWRKKSIARQHLHVPRSCRRRLAILQQLSLKQDDLEWPPLLPGCGTQHPLRALGGTRVLLAAAPTTPPCFRRWRRSSSLHSAHIQRKEYFKFRVSGKSADFPETHFHGKGLGPDKFRRLRQTRIKFPLIMAKVNAAAI